MSHNKTAILLILASSLIFSSSLPGDYGTGNQGSPDYWVKSASFSKGAVPQPSRYIVRFKPGVSASEMKEMLEEAGAKPASIHAKSGMAVIQKFTRPKRGENGSFYDSESERASLQSFMDSISEYVDGVEEDKVYDLLLQDSAPLVSVPAAWAAGYNGTNSSVCVIDTGIDYFSSHLPQDFEGADFTTTDWCISAPQLSSTGGVMKYKLNVSDPQEWLAIGAGWRYNTSRYDLLVHAPNGTLLANTSNQTPLHGTYEYFVIANITVESGIYTITLIATSASGERPAVYWGSDPMNASLYCSYYGCYDVFFDDTECTSGPNPVSDSSDPRAFYNLHPNDDSDSSHGTHVIGTVAKQTNPQGVAPGVKIYAAKVFASAGGAYTSDIMDAIDWCVSQGVDVISMSLGSSDDSSCSDDLAEYVKSYANGTLFVIAAGNSGPSSGTIGSPGCVKSALTVGAVDKSRAIASFSSRGPSNGLLKPEVVAPGVNINSTLAPDRYGLMSGTSMATPHVSGVAAILRQMHPDADAQELKALAIATTERAQCSYDYGCGLVNASRGQGLTLLESSAATSSKPLRLVLEGNSSQLNFLLYSQASGFSLNATDGSSAYSSLNDPAWNVQRIINLSANTSAKWNVTIYASGNASGARFYLVYPSSFVQTASVSVAPWLDEIWTRRSGIMVYFNYSVEGTDQAFCSLYNSTSQMANKTVSGSGNSSFRFSAREAGVHALGIFCRATAFPDRNASANVTVYYDRTRPSMAWELGSAAVNSTLVNLTYNASDDLSPELNCSLSAGSATYYANIPANLSHTEEVNFTREGRNTLRLTCTDLAGNRGRSTARLTVDSIPPNTTISGITWTLYNGTCNAAVSYRIYDQSRRMNETNYTIEGGLSTAGNLSTSRAGVLRAALPANLSYNVTINTWDQVRNFGSASQVFCCGTCPP